MATDDTDQASEIKAILDFWFEDRPHITHFKVDKALDAEIRERFGDLMEVAAAGGLDAWRATPEGALAEIVLLDQFSRNAYRGSARAFAQDPLACELAIAAIERGDDARVAEDIRPYFYLPLQHSENLANHDRARVLQEALGSAQHLKWAKVMRGTLERFGRFPRRNAALNRESTPDELEFLKPKPKPTKS